jgi:hypothetical protein
VEEVVDEDEAQLQVRTTVQTATSAQATMMEPVEIECQRIENQRMSENENRTILLWNSQGIIPRHSPMKSSPPINEPILMTSPPSHHLKQPILIEPSFVGISLKW